jgi:U3 small nucleolar RNA-associated protein 14
MSQEDDESSLSVSLSESEGFEEDDYADKLSTLQDLVSSVQPKDPGHSTAQRLSSGVQESSAPSDFGFNPKQKLTVADLLPTITNSDPRLRKSLKLLDTDDSKVRSKRTGIPAKLHVPLPKRQQNRLDRAAAYEKSKETLDRWMDSVKHNRRAEHLSFLWLILQLRPYKELIASLQHPTHNPSTTSKVRFKIFYRRAAGILTWRVSERSDIGV